MLNKMENKNYLFRLIACFVICFCLFVSEVLADITIDNGGSGTSFTGVWSTSGGSSPYGADSYWSRDGATYTWSFSSQPAGTYRVHMWWSGWPSRGSSINVSINHEGGPTPWVINQSVNAGQWNSLGEYLFGTSGSVTITAAYGSTVSTCADAVWFEFISGNTAPTAYIDSITPNPADSGQPVNFSGHGTDDGSISGYSWESNIDDEFFSDQDSFSTSSLKDGIHTISFKVKDDEDVWSEPVTKVLTVGSPPVEAIIDNDDPGTSFSGGSWGYSSGADPYGGTSRAEMQTGATYTFEAAVTGEHEVSLWWTYWSSRCSSVPVDIYDGNTLLATVPVNQRQLDLAGQWNVLGSYTFSGTARVVIRAQSSCSANADAVRFFSAVPPDLNYIEIEGPSSVNENSSADYRCIAHYTDGSSHEVEPDTWDENSGYATISPAGLLTTDEVGSSEPCRITATYEENGITRSDDLDITIENYVLPELDYIEIEGPSSVNENSSADYRCIAHYTDGSFHDVEPDTWGENSGYATISPTGLLTTTEVGSNEPCRISAIYTENSITGSDDLDITIQNYVLPVELIIDNGDSGTSSTGTWLQSGGAPPIGDDNLYSKTPGSTYTYQASINGYYEVYLHWTDWYSRCTSVPIRIYDGTQLVGSATVNQLQNGSQWNMIGLSGYSFSGTARVVIEATSTSCSTCADAVKFVSATAPELSYIVITGAASVNENSSTDYTCTAYYTDGSSHEVEPDTWDENSGYATISPTGLLTTTEVTSNEACRISATYSENGISRSEDLDITIEDNVAPVEVIIDNDDPGTSYSGGSWDYSSGLDPYDGSSRAEIQGGATYTFEGAVTGYQAVSLWWTWFESRCSEVPVDIYDGTTLLDTVVVDQQSEYRAGSWNFLGTYLFNGTARVVIRSQSGCSSCADAVKFVPSVKPELDRVQIEGPPALRENTSYDYELRAYYTDGKDRLVEADSWSVDCPGYADISTTGLLTSNEVTAEELCRVTANYTDDGVFETDTNDVYIKNIVHGNVLRHKWTVNLSGGGQMQPVMGDIDGDGVQEIVVAVDSNNIVAINGKTGAIEWSAPGSNHAVELADLNKDGIPEILFGIERRGSIGPRVRALRGDGSTLWTSPQLHGDLLTAFPIATADIDGDGYPEIYFATEDTDPEIYSGNIEDYDGAVFKLDHNGNVLAEAWVWHPCWGGMAIGDTNNDGVFELYVNDRRAGYSGMTESQGIHALNAHTLEFLWGRPDIQHSSPHPVLADVLGDSNLEVIATEITLKGPHVLDPETGDSILDYSDRNLPTHGAPTVYDIDRDGHLEYIVSTSYPSKAPYKFVVFDLISGIVDFETYFPFRLTWSPSVGDVTGDGFMEILAATGDQLEVVGDSHNGSYPLVVYDKNFNMIDWVDMPEGTGQLTPARVYDTDGDGYNEVVVAGFYGKLMVYDTDAPTPNPAPRSWVQLYSEYRRGAAEYVPAPGK